MQACDSRLEFRPSFTVKILLDGKPLPGVKVQVSSVGEANGHEIVSVVTARDGKAHVSGLGPGEYDLETDLLGISAGGGCFHVSAHPSFRAKRNLKYEWGDLSPTVREAAGTFEDLEPAQGGSQFWNYFHAAKVPVADAKLTLRDPVTGAVYTTTSDGSGRFSFGRVADAVYVLHTEALLPNNRGHDSANILVKIDPGSTSDTLPVMHRDPGFGSCGGTGLEFPH